MYQLLSAIAKLNNFDGRYHPVDISTTPLYQVYANHISVYATLTHTVVGGEYTLDLDNLPQGLRQSSQTLPEWLIVNGSNTLPVTTEPLDTTFRYARFYDLWQWNFMARGHNQLFHPTIQLVVEEQVDEQNESEMDKYQSRKEDISHIHQHRTKRVLNFEKSKKGADEDKAKYAFEVVYEAAIHLHNSRLIAECLTKNKTKN